MPCIYADRNRARAVSIGRYWINDALRSRISDKNLLLVHPHAQRTGGGAFRRRVFVPAFGEEQIYHRHFVPGAMDTGKPKPWHSLTATDLENYRAYSDLSNYRATDIGRPCLGVTMLRQPLYRGVSLYHFIQRQNGHRHQELAKNSSIEEFYRIAPDTHPSYYKNLQCRRICNREDANAALDMIEKNFIAIGLTEHLAEFASALCDLFGWAPVELRGADADADRYEPALTPSLREMLEKQNSQDIKLFDAMRKRIG